MTDAVIVRRRKLGMSSCREVAARTNSDVKVWRSDKGQCPEAPLYIRWGCTANVPGNTVLNTAKAIHQVNDKAGFRMVMNEHGLCPSTYTLESMPPGFFRPDISFVFRPKVHSRGRHLYVAKGRDECEAAILKCGPGWYASPLINKVAEYRVGVVQGRAVWVAEKTPGNPDEVAWNVARGGRFDNVRWDNWPLKAVKKSIEAFNLTDLDFGGVDVMVDGEGEAYVIEINSAPSLTSDYRQTCFAKAFDYIIENGKDRIPLIEKKGGYRKFIHPAVCERAQLKEQV